MEYYLFKSETSFEIRTPPCFCCNSKYYPCICEIKTMLTDLKTSRMYETCSTHRTSFNYRQGESIHEE